MKQHSKQKTLKRKRGPTAAEALRVLGKRLDFVESQILVVRNSCLEAKSEVMALSAALRGTIGYIRPAETDKELAESMMMLRSQVASLSNWFQRADRPAWPYEDLLFLKNQALALERMLKNMGSIRVSFGE